MKAKEYFEKYGEGIMEEARSPEIVTDGPMAKMYISFHIEARDMIKQRNVKTDNGLFGIVREMNDKWNAVANLFIKKYGVSPIKRDGFKIGWMQQLNLSEEEKARLPL